MSGTWVNDQGLEQRVLAGHCMGFGVPGRELAVMYISARKEVLPSHLPFLSTRSCLAALTVPSAQGRTQSSERWGRSSKVTARSRGPR